MDDEHQDGEHQDGEHQDGEHRDEAPGHDQPTYITRRGDDLAADVDELAQVSAAATGPNGDDLRDRRDVVEQHARHPDAVGILALQDERLVGFVYGTRSERGQWWHDHLRAALSPQERERWTRDAFAVRELVVLPSQQGEGIGQELLERLLARPEARRHAAVLLPARMDNPVERLARRLGFEDVVTSLPVDADGPHFRVMGRDTDTGT